MCSKIWTKPSILQKLSWQAIIQLHHVISENPSHFLRPQCLVNEILWGLFALTISDHSGGTQNTNRMGVFSAQSLSNTILESFKRFNMWRNQKQMKEVRYEGMICEDICLYNSELSSFLIDSILKTNFQSHPCFQMIKRRKRLYARCDGYPRIKVTWSTVAADWRCISSFMIFLYWSDIRNFFLLF